MTPVPQDHESSTLYNILCIAQHTLFMNHFSKDSKVHDQICSERLRLCTLQLTSRYRASHQDVLAAQAICRIINKKAIVGMHNSAFILFKTFLQEPVQPAQLIFH